MIHDPVDNAMAAAIVAAARIAENGIMSLVEETEIASKDMSGDRESPSLVSLSHDTGDDQTILISFTDNSKNELEPDNGNDTSDDFDQGEENAEKRLARNRERNREHARRTRLRKKAQLEKLKLKAKGLEDEGVRLKQSIEECNIASILLGISSGNVVKSVDNTRHPARSLDNPESSEPRNRNQCHQPGDKRKRAINADFHKKPSKSISVGVHRGFAHTDCGEVLSNQNGGVYKTNETESRLTHHPLEDFRPEEIQTQSYRKRGWIATIEKTIKLTVDGETHLLGGGKTHINWKTGVYCDDKGVQKQLAQQELEELRRERNRMHAKMTRDRKKCYIATIQKKIDELADENMRLRETLTEVARHHFGPNAITPHASPLIAAFQQEDHLKTPDIQDKMSSPAIVRG